ncbi:Type IV secretion system protein VirB8 [Candidatus Megaera polyxenophila]|nr:Type IV secretion system protein VirB8 [Candidatus Megaera polyxenophila]
MEPLYKSLKTYVESGEYFIDTQNWYKYKYLHPFSHRSFLFILTVTILVLFTSIIINIYNLFPIITPVRYSILTESGENKSAQIINADQIENNPLASIADIMLRKYVIQRETYDYNDLKKQFIYIKNNSTRIVFRRFYNYMNINNASSPVLLYQKDIKRTVSIISSSFLSDTKTEIKFHSIARNITGDIVEDMIWQAVVDYEIDQIDTNLPPESRFNFAVTDYQVQLLEDKKQK